MQSQSAAGSVCGHHEQSSRSILSVVAVVLLLSIDLHVSSRNGDDEFQRCGVILLSPLERLLGDQLTLVKHMFSLFLQSLHQIVVGGEDGELSLEVALHGSNAEVAGANDGEGAS